MSKVPYLPLALVATVLLVALAGCGGEAAFAPAAIEGTISVDNQTEVPLEVHYFDNDRGAVVVAIPAGSFEDITSSSFRNGSQSLVKFVSPLGSSRLTVPVEDGIVVRATTIDVDNDPATPRAISFDLIFPEREISETGEINRRAKDGKIFVRNKTESELTISFFDESQGKKVVVKIKGNESKEVSDVLKGGTKVIVRVEAIAVRSDSKPFVDIPMTINGSLAIVINRTEASTLSSTSNVYSGLIEYEVTGA